MSSSQTFLLRHNVKVVRSTINIASCTIRSEFTDILHLQLGMMESFFPSYDEFKVKKRKEQLMQMPSGKIVSSLDVLSVDETFSFITLSLQAYTSDQTSVKL